MVRTVHEHGDISRVNSKIRQCIALHLYRMYCHRHGASLYSRNILVGHYIIGAVISQYQSHDRSLSALSVSYFHFYLHSHSLPDHDDDDDGGETIASWCQSAYNSQ